MSKRIRARVYALFAVHHENEELAEREELIQEFLDSTRRLESWTLKVKSDNIPLYYAKSHQRNSAID